MKDLFIDTKGLNYMDFCFHLQLPNLYFSLVFKCILHLKVLLKSFGLLVSNIY